MRQGRKFSVSVVCDPAGGIFVTMSTQGYKDLIVWQKSVALVPKIYALLKDFPTEERFALADQIRRAAISVPANIAEGQARNHKKEFLQFLGIAKGSLAELDTLLIVAEKLSYVSPVQLETLEPDFSDIRRTLSGLMRTLN